MIGDVRVDKFVYGKVERVSPEAHSSPDFQHETSMLGGAGNVARNIVALAGKVWLAGVIGQDEAAATTSENARKEGVDACLVRVLGHPTTVKTRYISGSQQILRVDVERNRLDAVTSERLYRAYLDVSPELSAVVLSDYAKGVLEPDLVARIIIHARGKGLPVIVDPKT